MTDGPNHQQLPLAVVPGTPNPGSTTGTNRRRVRSPHARERRTARPPWRMSDQARRTGQEGVAMARRELERARGLATKPTVEPSPSAA